MKQPPLPDITAWPDLTEEWWRTWGDDPRTANCQAADWLFLMDGAFLHATIWGSGDVSKVSDLRAHVKAFEARLKELAESSPAPRKGTPLDELAKRRAQRESRAARKQGS